MLSNATDGGSRHLALVFFDMLFVDDTSLLSHPYSDRRAALERAIEATPGYAMLAERICIDLTKPDAEENCRKYFSNLKASHEEGTVIKAECAQYGERRWPWVKVGSYILPLRTEELMETLSSSRRTTSPVTGMR